MLTLTQYLATTPMPTILILQVSVVLYIRPFFKNFPIAFWESTDLMYSAANRKFSRGHIVHEFNNIMQVIDNQIVGFVFL